MSSNPFSEPEDDRTIIRPAPGGRRSMAAHASAPASATRAPARSAAPAEETKVVPINVTPLAAAAAPLLQLLARLRNTLHQPDAGDLRERTERELQNFQQRARDLEIPMDQVRPAHFALCASIDDVVLDTPWGAASKWASRPLLSAFHHGASGAGQAFGQLQQLRQNADKFRPAIELIYLCISLGATGRSAASQGGAGGFDRIREETYAIIAAPHQGTDPELSRHWKGVDSPYRSTRGRWPIWVVATVALAACGGLFVWVSTGLNAASDDLQARVLAASPARMPQITRAAVVQPLPPPPAPPQPTIIDRLRDLLRPEIGQGLVSVLGTAATPIVRITNRGMFRAGSASVEPGSVPLIERIAAALKGQAGTLHVIGYTDSQPIRTVRFPSNFQLSAARALAVRSIVARVIGDPARVSSEGRADADPVASNATPEGREQNRRIEIVLQSAD